MPLQGSQISFGTARCTQDSLCISVRMNRVSSRVEEGTSGFLSLSDFDRSVSAQLEQESQTYFCVEEWNSVCLSSCSRCDRHFSSCIWNLPLFRDNTTGVSRPLHVETSSTGLHSKRCPGIGTYLEWTGKSVSFGIWHDP